MRRIKTGLSRNMDRPGYTVEAGMGRKSTADDTQFERIYHDNKGNLVGGMTQLVKIKKEKGGRIRKNPGLQDSLPTL